MTLRAMPTNDDENDPTAFDIDDLPSLRDEPRDVPRVTVPHRVMNISPSEADQSNSMTDQTNARPVGTSEEVFLSPRVVDQESFDELATTMRTLVDEAVRSTQRLETVMHEARSEQEAPAKAAAQLQERLRLGARMLKAFQAQIDRVDATMSDLGDQHQLVEVERAQLVDRLEEVEKAAQSSITNLEGRLQVLVDDAAATFETKLATTNTDLPDLDDFQSDLMSMVDGAFERFEKLVKTHDPAFVREADADARIREMIEAAMAKIDDYARQRKGEIDRSIDRLADLQQRSDTFIERLETAEVNAAAICHRADDSARQVRSESEAAREIASQCVEAKAGLSAELRRSTQSLEDMDATRARIVEGLDDHVARADAVQQQLARAQRTIDAAAGRLDAATDTCDRLEQLLDRLEPWQGLLCHAELDDDGLPRPATELVETLRNGIGNDMKALADTLHGVARRINHLGLPTSDDPVAPARTSEIEPKVEHDATARSATEATPEVVTNVEADGEPPLRLRSS